MRIPRLIALTAVGAATAGLALTAPTATAADELGTQSLAAVLGNDLDPGNGFDKKGGDFDIVRELADAVVAKKGLDGTAVAVLADGTVAVTAFIPTDDAFSRLVKDLTGDRPKTEKAAYKAVRSLGINTVETVLLYHVVPGATVDAVAAIGSDGAVLTTAQGGTVTVNVKDFPFGVNLVDQDPDDKNAALIFSKLNINVGNYQIAHGIDRVLRPADL